MIKRIKLKPISKEPVEKIPNLQVARVSSEMLALAMLSAYEYTGGVVKISLSDAMDLTMFITPKFPTIRMTKDSIIISPHESFTVYLNNSWETSMSPTRDIVFKNVNQPFNEILHDYYEYLADQVNNWLDGSYVKWNCRYAEEVRKRNG